MTEQQTVLRVRGAQHSYGRTVALDGVDLDVGAGECVALLGPNGAGKTTLVNLAIGLLTPQGGEFRCNGGNPRDAAARRRLGVVQQTLGFPTTLKVGELVTGAAIRAGRHRGAAGPVLAELDLTDLAGRRATKLSGGQRQRVQLAMALVADPALLVLDEPTAGLDVPTRQRFWRIIDARRDRGTGVLVTTHLIDEAGSVADRVVVIDGGTIVAEGTPADLMSRLPDRTVVARTRLDDAQLARLPGVASVGRDGEHVRLTTRSPEALVGALLAADGDLSDLRVDGAGLEEAVVSLTRLAHPARAEVA
ncbi:multidrug ABC transporter ATP-binding protein [Amycolatopsis antarctica]|uniref:Multidrug ABC transporter ATP-binding protein n=1 Tax=Amycolatopsis antarctica TaxID=1854586 RepID=A0A263CVM6_9PSEU|nr:ABC transporter ATP-binding protein [Amycolatopsis antarctica]OZM70190.1 multidrug ABC transporter ATP-binding protein [Amycolatopsis antarctica]